MAQKNFDFSKDVSAKDIAKINFYQIPKHRGSNLSEKAITDIKSIIERHPEGSAFIFCGNLLLGSATATMLKNCITDYGDDDVLDWPIIKLADPAVLFPS